MVDVILDPKVTTDELAYPRTRPQVVLPTVSGSSLSEKSLQFLEVVERKPGLRPRLRSCRQRVVAFLRQFPPAAHRALAGSDKSSDLVLTAPVAEQVDRASAAPLQFLCTSLWSHVGEASLNVNDVSILFPCRSQ